MKKLAFEIKGEYWWEDGHLTYADGDVGDYNHAAVVIRRASYEVRDILESETDYPTNYSDEEQGLDWKKAEKYLLEEWMPEEVEKLRSQGVSGAQIERLEELLEDEDWAEYLTEFLKVPEDLLAVALDRGGYSHDYAMKNWGWMAMRGNHLECWSLDLSKIASFIDEVLDVEGFEEDSESDLTFNIEVKSTGKYFTDVPLEVINSKNTSELIKHRTGKKN